jgi:uncharacterized protein
MATTLVVPGMDGGGADHWLSWLESTLPDTRRVTQTDCRSLDLSHWAAAVQAELSPSHEPVAIVAHGFGCLAALHAAMNCPGRIEAALLVVPFDPDVLRLAWMLPEEPLPFPAAIVTSSNDPYMRPSKAAFWANYWSCDLVDVGRAGSIDPASGFGPWPAALEILDGLRNRPRSLVASLASRDAERLSRAI